MADDGSSQLKPVRKAGRGPVERTRIYKRRLDVAELYLQGFSQAMICEKLQVSPATVYNDITAIQDEWRRTRLRNFDEARSRELMTLDRIEREAWAEWERSKKDVTIKEVSTDDENKKRAKQTQRGQTGAAAYLDVVLRCVDRRCKLLGLDSPTKIAPVTPDGENPYTLSVELLHTRARQMSVPQLEALAALAEAFGPVSEATIDVAAAQDHDAAPAAVDDSSQPGAEGAPQTAPLASDHDDASQPDPQSGGP